MNWRLKAGGCLVLSLICCNFPARKKFNPGSAKVTLIGSLKGVMREGQIDPKIRLDTITNKEHLYGLGPESYLKGELLILDGQSFVSRASTDSTITVENSYNITSPFFAYVKVEEWHPLKAPIGISSLKDLGDFFSEGDYNDELVPFKLEGVVTHAKIHVLQPPPDGIKIAHDEAHKRKVSYVLVDEEVSIFGFYSGNLHGILTHHNSAIHAHLINSDKTIMGHLDDVEFKKMKYYIPKSLMWQQ